MEHWGAATCPHGVSERAKHIAEKEVAEFDRIDAGQQESELHIQLAAAKRSNMLAHIRVYPPLSTLMIQYWAREEDNEDRNPDEQDWPIKKHCTRPPLLEIEPYTQSQQEKQETW